MNKSTVEHRPLNYPVQVRSLPAKGLTVNFEANESECKLLAYNHDLVDVVTFIAQAQILPWKKRGIRVKGQLKARLVQQCIITLEEMPTQIEENFEAIYLPADSKLTKYPLQQESGALFLDAEGPDTPEVFHGDSLDIGAILEEFFELSIDRYPRKAKTEKIRPMVNPQIEAYNSPFAILKKENKGTK